MRVEAETRRIIHFLYDYVQENLSEELAIGNWQNFKKPRLTYEAVTNVDPVIIKNAFDL